MNYLASIGDAKIIEIWELKSTIKSESGKS